jgi:hypothetical protein
MDRSLMRCGYRAAMAALLAGMIAFGGCSAVATMAYILKGNEIPPEYTGLRGKKVAVVCRPVADLQYHNSSAARELSTEVARLLRQRVAKCKVIDPRKVDEWTDEHPWNEFSEVGEALDADMVLGIDLEGFSLYEGPNLYQGKADVRITVIDCRDNNEIAFERTLPQTVYPPNSGIPASERSSESHFRREFLGVTADYIGRFFYPHDAYADYAGDAAAWR